MARRRIDWPLIVVVAILILIVGVLVLAEIAAPMPV
jgi:hypothetical protein